ncbi:hydroxypyruvate reductase [Alphaproteobacteria bacterium]|nr:hydroxypyruvate reductase [Alphaproteobacteria bacterium]
MDRLRHLAEIFDAALARVDPRNMLESHVALDGDDLLVAFESEHHRVNLANFDRIFAIGVGKAAARMAQAIEKILGERLSGGVIVTKYGHGEKLDRLSVIEAGHPIPDDNSVRGAKAIMDLTQGADERTLFINLVSGGGSALACAPYFGPETALSLDDKQATTSVLLACGAEIGEINCLRKHLSMIKGGRLLNLMAPARSLNFILSDVVGDDLNTIASGMTHPDKTTFSQVLSILDKYNIRNKIPVPALEIFTLGAEGRIAETPKPGIAAAGLARNIMIGTNLAACLAAKEKGRALGYNVAVLTSSLTGEAREAAKFMYGIAIDARKNDLFLEKPALVIVGGETTVTVCGTGKGGRNQEMALAFLSNLAKDELKGQDISFLSASTDGSDGPTDAAGAFAGKSVLAAADAAGLSIADYLTHNDSYHFFDKIDFLLKTGPTMTNVGDLHMAIIAPATDS